MEAFLYTVICFCLFTLGVGLGGVIEHRRGRLLREIEENKRRTIEAIAPALDRIQQNTEEQLRIIQGTLIDLERFNELDPDETLELPKVTNDDREGNRRAYQKK